MKLTTLTTLIALASTAPALADQPGPEAGTAAEASPFHLDLEVDPTAYAFSGFSVHVGLGWRDIRLDLGTFGMDIPEFFHGNEGWSASFAGAGAKLQWFPLATQHQLFVDVSGGVSRQRVELRATGASSSETAWAAGLDAGWRFLLPYGFYATPWAGVSVDFDADDVMLDGQRYQKRAVVPFAAVHLGYRFR